MKKGKIDFVKIASVAAGAVAGELAANKIVPNLSPMYVGLGQTALGVLLPVFLPKVAALSNVGDGMIAIGATTLAKSLAPNIFAKPSSVQGIGDSAYMIDEDFQTVSGDAEYDTTVNGPDVLAGDDPGLAL